MPGLRGCARRAMREHEVAAPCDHGKGSEGRSCWEIEWAQEADRIAREEAAEQWKRDMATPPVVGAVIGIKRWKWAGAPAWEWVPDVPEHATVQRTYANHTVGCTAESGEHIFLARNEFTGDWHEICGQPTAMRLPCKSGGTGVQCRVRHKAGQHLRDDTPWD